MGQDLTHCGRGQNCRGRQYNGGGPHTLWAWSELQGEDLTHCGRGQNCRGRTSHIVSHFHKSRKPGNEARKQKAWE